MAGRLYKRRPNIKALAMSAVPVSHTGNLSETILATVAIPSGAMGPNGLLRISSDWTVTNSVNSKTPRTRLGGIGGQTFDTVTVTTLSSVHSRLLISNRNSPSSQYGVAERVRGSDLLSTFVSPVTAAIDTSVAQDLVFTAQLANAGETITLERYLVELLTPWGV